MERRESFRERRKRQQARRRLLGKLAAVLIGAVFFVWAVQEDGRSVFADG